MNSSTLIRSCKITSITNPAGDSIYSDVTLVCSKGTIPYFVWRDMNNISFASKGSLASTTWRVLPKNLSKAIDIAKKAEFVEN